MSKIFVAYWTMTGNTALMAQAVGEGIEQAGKEAAVVEISSITPEDLKDETTFALGCPAMGDEVLEETEMEPFVMEVETFVKGKNLGLFGSYSWHDGQWMIDWAERMKADGVNLVGGEGVTAYDAPDEEALERCRALGKQLAELA